MIEFFEVMFRALTGLKLTMPNLLAIFVFFVLGFLFSKFAKNIGVLKALFVVIAGYFIASILSALLGVFSLAFAIGFLSNQSLFFYRLLIWAEDLSEIWYSLKHQHAFEEIRSRESELEAEINALREELKRKARGEKPRTKPSAGQKSSGQGSSSSYQPKGHKNQADIDRCLKILELETGKDYSQKEIKKAYRRLAMIHHPDMPTGSHEAFVQLGVAMEYLVKFAKE
jgi:DnaJ-domain-containing protein 1